MNRIAGERDFYKRGYEAKCDRLAKERAEHKKADKLLDAVCVLIIGGGIAWALQGIMMFFTWLNVGW